MGFLIFQEGACTTSSSTAKARCSRANPPQQPKSEERLERIGKIVEHLHSHLKMDKAGICLPADFRWAVATEARACMNCPGCNELKTEKACAMKGKGHGEHAIMKTVEHSSCKEIPYSINHGSSLVAKDSQYGAFRLPSS